MAARFPAAGALQFGGVLSALQRGYRRVDYGHAERLRKAVVEADLQAAAEDERLGIVFLDRLAARFGETPFGFGRPRRGSDALDIGCFYDTALLDAREVSGDW